MTHDLPFVIDCVCVCVCVQNIHVTAYSPMGTPPSSAMFKDYQPALVMNDPVVKDLAKKYNKNVGQVQSALVLARTCINGYVGEQQPGAAYVGLMLRDSSACVLMSCQGHSFAPVCTHKCSTR